MISEKLILYIIIYDISLMTNNYSFFFFFLKDLDQMKLLRSNLTKYIVIQKKKKVKNILPVL